MSFIYQTYQVIFHLPANLSCLTFTKKLRSPSVNSKIEVILHLQKVGCIKFV